MTPYTPPKPTRILSSGVPVYEASNPRTRPIQVKATKSGELIDVQWYRSPVYVDYAPKSKRSLPDILSRHERARDGLHTRRSDNIARSRARMTRLIHTNMPTKWRNGTSACWVTLTYKGEYTERARDLELTQDDWERYAKKIRKKYGDLQYVMVRELQTKNGRNAWHFHVLYFNMPWNQFSDFAEAWGYSDNVDVERVKVGFQHSQRMAGYIAKYMGKSNPLASTAYKRMYTVSLNLLQPETYSDPLDVHALMTEIQNTHSMYKSTPWYDLPFFGNATRYETYKPKNETPPKRGSASHAVIVASFKKVV